MLREGAARAYFLLSLLIGRLLRAGRYATVRMVNESGEPRVRKRRSSYAPLVVWIGGRLVTILNTGMRVLAQREWEKRERSIYQSLGRPAIRVRHTRILSLPVLPGKTLATLLEETTDDDSTRLKAITLAAAALATFHRQGFTHGDAMAENVMIDLVNDEAHWFDFETVHDSDRPTTWCRADDLRALLSTCALRAKPGALEQTVEAVMSGYGDEAVFPLLSAGFQTVFRRSLPFHLGQAPMTFDVYREIVKLLQGRPSAERHDTE